MVTAGPCSLLPVQQGLPGTQGGVPTVPHSGMLGNELALTPVTQPVMLSRSLLPCSSWQHKRGSQRKRKGSLI